MCKINDFITRIQGVTNTRNLSKTNYVLYFNSLNYLNCEFQTEYLYHGIIGICVYCFKVGHTPSGRSAGKD